MPRPKTQHQSPELTQSIDYFVGTLLAHRNPLNTFIWMKLAEGLQSIFQRRGSGFFWRFISPVLLVLMPLPFLFATPFLPGNLASVYSAWIWVSSLTILVAILAVHISFLVWKPNVKAIATLAMHKEDVEFAGNIMLAAFRLKPQLAFSFVASLALLAMICLIVPDGSIIARIFLSLPFFGMFVVLGNGAYWAIMSFIGILIIYKTKELRVNFFDPSSTPGIKAFSEQLAVHLIFSSITFLVLLAGFTSSTFQSKDQGIRTISIIWFGLAIFVITVTFLYHQVLHYLVIRREKNRVLDKLALTIVVAYGKEPAEEILKRIELYQSVRGTKATALVPSVIFSYVAGVGVQLIPLVVTNPQFISWLQTLASTKPPGVP